MEVRNQLRAKDQPRALPAGLPVHGVLPRRVSMHLREPAPSCMNAPSARRTHPLTQTPDQTQRPSRSSQMLSGSSVPIVVVLSGSMEPAMQRGDLLLLVSGQTYRNGDVVVFDINDRETPIVHRIIRTHRRRARPKANPGDPDVWTYPMHATIAADRNGPAEAERRESRRVGWYNVNPGLELLTKGDNNFGHDVPLYAPGQKWLTESDVVGAVRIYIAHLGRITLFLHDYPTIKYILICVLVVVTFTYTE